jgi:hypothetical protein
MKSTYRPGFNRIVNCTGQLPFLAQAFSVYGGEANSVENCRAIDIPYGAGLFASTTFPTEFGFRGTTTFRRIAMTRAGGDDGAIGIVANLVDLPGLRFEDVDVLDSPTDGIKFTSMKDHVIGDTVFDRIHIVRPGLAGAGCGIVEASGAVGSATVNNVTVVDPKTVGCRDNAAAFKLIRGAGNSGLDEKKLSSAESTAARPAPVGP